LNGDAGDLPADLRAGTFDVTYTGGGVLVWIHDIDRWADVVASTLRPGGKFVLYDGHPVTGCLWNYGAGIVVADDYFGRTKPENSSDWGHFPGGENASSIKAEFSWPLGDIVTALIRAGLVIESLREFPNPEVWRFGDQASQAARLPGAFLLVAHRPT
jgi:SAM-dependent methyltransferase